MHGRTDRNRKIFASVFLLGYVFFVFLSITHFHPFSLSSLDKTVQIESRSSSKPGNDLQDNCPVCHLYSTVNILSLAEVASDNLTVEIRLNSINEKGYQTGFFNITSLRGPPSSIYKSM